MPRLPLCAHNISVFRVIKVESTANGVKITPVICVHVQKTTSTRIIAIAVSSLQLIEGSSLMFLLRSLPGLVKDDDNILLYQHNFTRFLFSLAMIELSVQLDRLER